MRRERGSSLIEIVMAVSAFSIIALGFVGVSRSATTTIENGSLRQGAALAGNRGCERMVRALRSGSFASLRTVPYGYSTAQPVTAGTEFDNLTFTCFPFDPDSPDSLPTTGTSMSIGLVASATDPANGRDDDRDGIVDGRDVAMTPSGGTAELLVQNATAFSGVLNGRTVTFTVTLARRGSNGKVITNEITQTVEVRND